MSRVLTLNASYMPLALVDWMRAICLIFQDKAEVVAEGSRTVSSPSKEMKVPAIIRLKSAVYPTKRRVRLSRKNVLLRDGHTCQYCRQTFSKHQMNLDHVQPRSRGGQTRWTNIVASCIPCNTKKGDRTPAEAGMQLLKEPVPPNWTLAQEIAHSIQDIPEAWEPYLAGFLKRSMGKS